MFQGLFFAFLIFAFLFFAFLIFAFLFFAFLIDVLGTRLQSKWKGLEDFLNIFAHVNYQKPYASYSRAPQNSNKKRANHWLEPSCDLMDVHSFPCAVGCDLATGLEENDPLRWCSYVVQSIEPTRSIMTTLLLAISSVRSLVPPVIILGITPHYHLASCTLRLAKFVIPNSLFEKIDNFMYCSYQALVSFFFESFCGTEVKWYVSIWLNIFN